LADVTLPAGFTWNNTATSVGNAGARAFIATFTPSDTDNYNILTNVSVTVTVNKANQAAPAAPGVSTGRTSSSITIPTVIGQQYAITTVSDLTPPAADSAWITAAGTSHTFTGLSADTSYNIFTRLAATENYNASPATMSTLPETTALYGIEQVVQNVNITYPNSSTAAAQVGTVLTAGLTRYAGANFAAYNLGTVAYDWLVNGVSVQSGAANTFTIPVGTANDALIYVRVSAENTANTSAFVQSSNVTVGLVPFTAVTGITGVPTLMTAGTPLTLTGTVLPANATNKTVVWSVVNAGGTGAVIVGNTLNAASAGTATVRATVINGLNPTSNYTQDFNIAVVLPTFVVTVNNGEASTAGEGDYTQGETVTIDAGTLGGHTFGGWTVNSGGVTLADAANAVTTFVMPANNVSVTANWVQTTPGPTMSPSPVKDITVQGGNGAPNLPAEHNTQTGNVRIGINTAMATALVNAAKARQEDGDIPEVKLDLSKIEGVESATLNAAAVSTFKNADVSVTVKFPDTEITLLPEALEKLADAGGAVRVEAEIVPMKELTGMQAAQVKGYETVISIDVFAGGKKVDVPLTVSLPYKLKPNENPAAVRVWYMDGMANLTCMNGVYDVVTGMVTFTVHHQSYFVVGYDPVLVWINIFNDLAVSHKFYEAIAFMNYYGFVSGYNDGTVGPDNTFTRAQFAALLWNLEGNPMPSGAPRFTDVQTGAWYFDAVTWAVENGIVAGYGDGRYGADDPITRQQASQMLYNYAVNFKKYEIPENRPMPNYADGHRIDQWAATAARRLGEAGVLRDEDDFRPNDDATRGEAFDMFRNFLRVGHAALGVPIYLRSKIQHEKVDSDSISIRADF
jgi:uncharacterized repeat protein (TIGR02543 family)